MGYRFNKLKLYNSVFNISDRKNTFRLFDLKEEEIVFFWGGGGAGVGVRLVLYRFFSDKKRGNGSFLWNHEAKDEALRPMILFRLKLFGENNQSILQKN